MDHTRRHTGYANEHDADWTAFAAFVLAHAGCDRGPAEFRLGDGRLACWCRRCDEVRTFGPVRPDGEKARMWRGAGQRAVRRGRLAGGQGPLR